MGINVLQGERTVRGRKDGSPLVKAGLPQVFPDLSNTLPLLRKYASTSRPPGRAAGSPPSGEAPHTQTLRNPSCGRKTAGRGGAWGNGRPGPSHRNVLSDGEERQTHTAPPPGNGGRVPRSGSASGSALNEGTNVRLRSRKRDEDGEWIEVDELGMVIGFEGELVVVSFTEGRTATLEASDLLVVPPRTGR